jgi:hypothetical protein
MKNTNKLDKFDLDDFIKKDKTEKKDFIISESQKIKKIPKDVIKDLHQAYRYKEVINKFVTEYIKEISKKGISSEVFFVKDTMYLLDNNNRLLKFN